MSTKTLRKRIALVAVSVLGFGLLSTSPAFAADGDVTAVTAATTASSTQLTVTATLTTAATTTATAAGQKTNLELGIVGLQVVASPDADLSVGTRIWSNAGIDGLVTVTAAGSSSTAGTVAFVFATKVAPAAGLYQFRVWGTTVANKLTVTEAAGVNVNYNPPILAAAELQASTVEANSHRVKSVALTTGQAGGQVGTEISVTPSYLAEAYTLTADNGSNIVANAEKATLRYVLTKPTGSTATLSASTEAILQTSTATASASAATAVAAAASSTGTAIRFTPDVAGAYTVTAYHDADGDLSLDSGEAQAIRSYTIGAAGSMAISLLQYGALTATGSSNDGTLIRVSLLSGTNAGSLASNETIGITVVGGGVVDEVNASDVADAATYTLGRSDFNSSGRAWVNIVSAADGVNSIVFTGSGGNMAGVGASTTAEFVTVNGEVATAPAKSVSTATGYKINSMALGNNGAGAGQIDTDYLKGGSVTLKATTAVKETYVDFRFADEDKFLAGLNANAWNQVVKSDADKAFTITIAHASSGATPVATDATAGTMTFTGTDADGSGQQSVVVQFRAQASAATSATVTPSVVRSALLGANSFTATFKDQFGVAMNNAAVVISVAGRNATSVSKNDTTSSLGQVTYSLTDAGLSTNTTMTDTITFDGPGGSSADGTASITYGAVSVGSVTVTSPNTTAGVATTVITTTPINAGSGGAEDGAVSVSAVIADSSGAVVAGVPVTWTVSGTSGAAITSTTKTSYTDSTGTASANVYGWTAGAYTITAAAGGKSGTGSITFGSTTATNARIVSATVSGSIVTAKVVDRFGNPVSGVKLYATKTGTGYFGNGLSKTDGSTDSSGTVDFNVAGGAASVTVSAVDPSAAAGTTYGQTCAKVGFTACGSTATALVAPVAGTTLVNEANVGNDIAPAGVDSASVAVADVAAIKAAADKASSDAAIAALKAQLEAAAAKAAADKASSDAAIAAAQAAAVEAAQAATDTAAEATDAANAATDAANASAEAADAATAAAQDAADAVAALSTQVSEMVNALKKQITALTNLVIKIQKKVKA